MKMMPCRSCGTEISKKADSCPHCGHAYVKSISAQLQSAQKFSLYVVLLPMIGLFIGFLVMIASHTP